MNNSEVQIQEVIELNTAQDIRAFFKEREDLARTMDIYAWIKSQISGLSDAVKELSESRTSKQVDALIKHQICAFIKIHNLANGKQS